MYQEILSAVPEGLLPKNFSKALHRSSGIQLLDGARLPAGTAGAGDLLLQKLYAMLSEEDYRPLLICSFLERLDEAVDLRPIFRALYASRRQIFIAVPHCCPIKLPEEQGNVTIIPI